MCFIVHSIYSFVLNLIGKLTFVFQNGPLLFSKPKFVFCWFIREFMSAVIFIEAYWKPQTVVWGTKQFRVRYGGVTEIVNKKWSKS